MLLSFAQFEREVSAERVRDKIAASKAKGLWMGGTPPLGYDAHERQLSVNEGEVQLVRLIFQKYIETENMFAVAEHLNAQGIRTKKWVARRSKREHGGGQFYKSNIQRILTNPLYIGKIAHYMTASTKELFRVICGIKYRDLSDAVLMIQTLSCTINAIKRYWRANYMMIRGSPFG